MDITEMINGFTSIVNAHEIGFIVGILVYALAYLILFFLGVFVVLSIEKIYRRYIDK